jgi:hypothetical protein
VRKGELESHYATCEHALMKLATKRVAAGNEKFNN